MKSISTKMLIVVIPFGIFFGMMDEYLQSFIKLFTREPTSSEDKHSLYNIYTNESIIH